MKIPKKVFGLIFFLGLKIFVLGQQDNPSQECLKKANEFRESVFILLDPGHGGPSNNGRTCLSGDPGAPATHNGIEYHEACMTTDLALGLRDILIKLGLDVDMTRNANIKQVNKKKAEKIRDLIIQKKEEKGDSFNPYFISIHFNSGSSAAHGNHGIYAHSNKTNESVQDIVLDAMTTNFLDHHRNFSPGYYTFPDVSLLDNQNTLSDKLQGCIKFVLGETTWHNRILWCARNENCNNQGRPSYKNMDIYRMGIFPLLSGWYAGKYDSCDRNLLFYINGVPFSVFVPNHFFSSFNPIDLPNDESIPVKHSLQEVEFISSPNFLNYLKLRPYVAMAMASAVADDIINDYVKKMIGGDACIKAALHLIDYPDDNQSSYSGSNDGLSHSKIDSPYLMPFNMINQEIIGLFNKIGVNPAITFNDFSMSMVNEHPVLIIPSGFLAQIENDSTFKINLEQYVKNGATIIVFGQQFGSHIDNVVPIPEGQSLHSYGWREDQSCYNGSVYFKTMHPALSGLYNERPSAGLDGFISVYPANATVLLRKTINQDPALLYYPYGNGTVILTTLYTDYGHAHSQASWEELRLIRDLVTFAKNPNLDIPTMWQWGQVFHYYN